jgi:tetratricopeptide (TPR) repeat protein
LNFFARCRDQDGGLAVFGAWLAQHIGPVAELGVILPVRENGMRVSIKSPRALTATIVLLQAFGRAFAADLGDCGHPDADRSIRGCSPLIERGLGPPLRQAELLLLRGSAYMINDDNDRAIKDLDEAIRLNPNEPEAFFIRGDAYFKKGSYDQAMADYDATSWLDPDHIGAYAARIDVYKKLGGDPLATGDPAFLAGKFNEVFVHIDRRIMLVWQPQKYWQWVERTFPAWEPSG